MSSGPVRDAFRAAWELPDLPLIETINSPADFLTPLPPVWATFGFSAEETIHTTMGSNPWLEESGVVAVFISSESGDTDAAVAKAADDVTTFWQMWISPDKNIWVAGIVGPRPPDPDAQGISYALVVEIHYRYQSRGV